VRMQGHIFRTQGRCQQRYGEAWDLPTNLVGTEKDSIRQARRALKHKQVIRAGDPEVRSVKTAWGKSPEQPPRVAISAMSGALSGFDPGCTHQEEVSALRPDPERRGCLNHSRFQLLAQFGPIWIIGSARRGAESRVCDVESAV